LGMTLTTFRPLERQDVMSRMGKPTSRDQSGKIRVDSSGWFPLVPNLEDDYGGNGVYTCASDYMTVLMSLLMDDAKLLKPQTVTEFFKPQLEDSRHLTDYLVNGPYSSALLKGLPADTHFNHALGGALIVNSVKDQHEPGTLFWGGLPNSFWVGANLTSPNSVALTRPRRTVHRQDPRRLWHICVILVSAW